jgi:hypothetical protein
MPRRPPSGHKGVSTPLLGSHQEEEGAGDEAAPAAQRHRGHAPRRRDQRPSVLVTSCALLGAREHGVREYGLHRARPWPARTGALANPLACSRAWRAWARSALSEQLHVPVGAGAAHDQMRGPGAPLGVVAEDAEGNRARRGMTEDVTEDVNVGLAAFSQRPSRPTATRNVPTQEGYSGQSAGEGRSPTALQVLASANCSTPRYTKPQTTRNPT